MPLYPEHNPTARIIKSPDPTNKDCWPKSPSQYVFIFEAIDLTGRALFAADWTGMELATVIWQQSPRQERAQAHLPRPKGGGAGRSHTIGTLPLPKPCLDFHVQDWWAEKRQPIWAENKRTLERLEKAIEWLAQKCRDGELTSHARFRSGGIDLSPMHAGEWNVESAMFHFVINGGNKRHFKQLTHTGPYESYVFFDKQELHCALKREPDAPLIVGKADLSRLSPYLRLAVHVALKRKYFSGDACDTKDAREAEVRAAWPDFIAEIDPVNSTVQQIAKLVAFPDPEAIKLGQRGAQSRKRGETPNI